MYISGIWGAKPPGRIELKIFLEDGIRDVMTCFKFGDDRFRGLASAEGQILPFPIDFDGRPYNTLTLPCERVISVKAFATCFTDPLFDFDQLSFSSWFYYLFFVLILRF